MFSRRSSIGHRNDEQRIFDSFMEFLRSELWQIPISEFIEQRSIVFDREPNGDDVPTNSDACQALYAEFRKIVNDLLDAHCTDGGTTRDQLMKTLKSTEQAKALSQKDRLLLEPIVAAQDFDVFVPMMMRKNIELQLQAIKMIEQLNGLLPGSLKLDQEEAEMWNTLGDEDESDRFIMISILKQSREEWKRDQQLQQELLAQMEAALRESLLDKSALEEMHRNEQMLFEQALNKSMHSFNSLRLNTEEKEEEKFRFNIPSSSATVEERMVEPIEKANSGSNAPIIQKVADTDSTMLKVANADLSILKVPNAVQNGRKNEDLMPNVNRPRSGTQLIDQKPPIMEKKRVSLGQVHAPHQHQQNQAPFGADDHKGGDLAYRGLLKERHDGSSSVSESQLRDRKQYLREQRDKLLKKKSQERERQLIQAAKQINQSRPLTAKAARELMEQKSEVDEARRRIAAKIKAEVINGKNN